MMRMLVTGGAGFIGANFVHYTVRHHGEYRVGVLAALTYAGDRVTLYSVADQIELIEGDICDRGLVDRLVAEADVVVHLAAESQVDNSLHDPEPFIRSNVLNESLPNPGRLTVWLFGGCGEGVRRAWRPV